MTHDNVRNGTTGLFAACDAGSGPVITGVLPAAPQPGVPAFLLTAET